MNITMIRPNLSDRRSHDALEPLVFAILKGLTPSDIDVKFYDDRLEPIPFHEQTDLVALTVETYTAKRAYDIADYYRAKGVPVVMGGYHPTFLPNEALGHADAVVLGDAEGVWEQVVSDACNGQLQKMYQQSLEQARTPLSNISFDRSLFKGKRYPNISAIQSWLSFCL
jgi:radical SAM superfamily enzyme YgiQ (UPF0313 family)